jgi:hypothetical protein
VMIVTLSRYSMVVLIILWGIIFSHKHLPSRMQN